VSERIGGKRTAWLAVVGAAVACLVLARTAAGQESVDLGPIDLVMPGAEGATASAGQDDQAPTESGSVAQAVADTLRAYAAPAARVAATAALLGLPLALAVGGRRWRGLPPEERALVVLTASMGRGGAFRRRLRSLAEQSPRVTPLAMMLAPRAFDTALADANHADRAFGQPLRHAVHGFRKA